MNINPAPDEANILTELKKVSLFDNVSLESLKHIKVDMVRHFSHGQTIFHQNENSKHLVVLLEGQACISRDGTFITCRTAPAVLGEQAFIDETTRSATLSAQGFVKAFVLPELIVRVLMCDEVFICNLLRLVSCKLREATDERARHYRREDLLFSEFKAHTTEAIIDRLLATGHDYGRPRFIDDAVILFSDIRDFSTRSAAMSPQEIAEQLSQYLSAIVDIIHHHGGLVDKFVGDAVMAVWGYTECDQKPVDAFRCAEEMVRAAAGIHFGGEPIRIGVGVNLGRVFSGNVGNDGKKQFTVLGTPVNLAARFESKAKELNAPIVLGEAFRAALPAEIRDSLTSHPDQDIKGDRPQTLFTSNPLAREGGSNK